MFQQFINIISMVGLVIFSIIIGQHALSIISITGLVIFSVGVIYLNIEKEKGK